MREPVLLSRFLDLQGIIGTEPTIHGKRIVDVRVFLSHVATMARWEVKRTFGMMGKNTLPVAIVLVLCLVATTGLTAERGLHIQDGIYRLGTDNPAVAGILGGDARFVVSYGDAPALFSNRGSLDIIIAGTDVYVHDSERGRSALRTLQRDYQHYLDSVYSAQQDLFAAYPLWIDVQEIRSELDFSATQSGRQISAVATPRQPPVPEKPVEQVPTPEPGIPIPPGEIRQGLLQSREQPGEIARYSDLLGSESPFGSFRIPSQLSPPLPFDSIILVFLFIFPLYFSSQFYMMSIMQERIERRGEVLLSSPAGGAAIVVGKALPYLAGMLAISTGIALYIRAPLTILLPLVPVILFFLASALVIGMVSRSFKELSFISIFFSTVATSYLFFPSIFANVHVISIVSPLTLIVLSLQGDTYTVTQYIYSTSLFFLTSVILFYVGIVNFREERLFSLSGIVARIREFVSAALSARHPYLSVFAVSALLVPFVFMVQMLLLVLVFNLPMPLSLVILIVTAACVEEVAKSVGIATFILEGGSGVSWTFVALGSLATAAGFLFAEKLLLFVTLAQITESIFGSILFLTLGSLAYPFLLHFACVLVLSVFVRVLGRKGYLPGLGLATLIHCLYNATIILGWI